MSDCNDTHVSWRSGVNSSSIEAEVNVIPSPSECHSTRHRSQPSEPWHRSPPLHALVGYAAEHGKEVPVAAHYTNATSCTLASYEAIAWEMPGLLIFDLWLGPCAFLRLPRSPSSAPLCVTTAYCAPRSFAALLKSRPLLQPRLRARERGLVGYSYTARRMKLVVMAAVH